MARDKDEHERRIGQQIAGKYRIERLLGAGGMGAVYVAQHEFTNRRVALKLMHAGFSRSKVAAERFLREARAPSAIGHPGIVEVLDGGREDDGSLYLVLELLEGQTLAQALRDERLPPQRVVELGLELLSALQAAHDAGFVHRDLKPENIFLPASGNPQIKLLDFGVAGLLVPETNPNLTAAGAVLGTPLYMSPEQALGRRIDARSDLWSLGAVLYQALSGELPFGGDTVPALIVSISTQPHLPLSVLRPELPRRVAAVVDRALQKGPDQRWPSAEAMAEALENALEPNRRTAAGERPAPASPAETSAAPRGIPGMLVVGAVLGAVLGGLGMAALAMRAHEPRAERAAPRAATASVAQATMRDDPPPEPQKEARPPAAADAPEPPPGAATLTEPKPAQAEPKPAEPKPTEPAPPASAPATPALAAEQMQLVVQRHQPELQRCYEQSVLEALLQAGAAQSDPKPLALTVQLAVGADGRVKKVALEGDAPPELVRCLTTSIEAFRFPESAAETQAGFPIVFQPQIVRQ